MRFLGYNISEHKTLKVALHSVFGVGPNVGVQVCRKLGLAENIVLDLLTVEHLYDIQKWVEENKVTEFELRKRVDDSLKRIKSSKSYRAMRHRYGLPVRGQRTHSNGRTQKKYASFRGVGLVKK